MLRLKKVRKPMVLLSLFIAMSVIIAGGFIVHGFMNNIPLDIEVSAATASDANYVLEISHHAPDVLFDNLSDMKKALEEIGLTFVDSTSYPHRIGVINYDSLHIGCLSQYEPTHISSETEVDLLLEVMRIASELQIGAVSWGTYIDDALVDAGLDEYFRFELRQIMQSAREQQQIDSATTYPAEQRFVSDTMPEIEQESPYRLATTLEEVRAIIALQDGSIPVTNTDVPEIRNGQANGIIITEQCLYEAIAVLNEAYAQNGYPIRTLITPRVSMPHKLEHAPYLTPIYSDGQLIGFENLTNLRHVATHPNPLIATTQAELFDAIYHEMGNIMWPSYLPKGFALVAIGISHPRDLDYPERFADGCFKHLNRLEVLFSDGNKKISFNVSFFQPYNPYAIPNFNKPMEHEEPITIQGMQGALGSPTAEHNWLNYSLILWDISNVGGITYQFLVRPDDDVPNETLVSIAESLERIR